MRKKLRIIMTLVCIAITTFDVLLTPDLLYAEILNETISTVDRQYATMANGVPFIEFAGWDKPFYISGDVAWNLTNRWTQGWSGGHTYIQFPGDGSAACAAVASNTFYLPPGGLAEVETWTVDNLAQYLGEGYESWSTTHPADEVGHVPTNTLTHRMVVNDEQFWPTHVKHGTSVRRGDDGELHMYLTWSYCGSGLGVTSETTWYTAIQLQLEGTVKEPTYVDPSVWNMTPADISWVDWSVLQTNSYRSPLVNSKTPQPSMNATENNIGFLEQPLAISLSAPFKVGASFNPNDDIHVVGAVTDKPLNLAANPSSMVDLDYRLDLTDTTGIDHLLSPDKKTFTGIGTGNFNAKVTDYEGDITHFERPVLVGTDSNAGLGVKVWTTHDDKPYEGQWMSSDPSADTLRQGGLSMQGDSNITGNYDLVTQLNGGRISTTGETKTATAAVPFTNGKETGVQHANTGTSGIPVTSQALETGEHSTILSPKSDAVMVKYDNDQPSLNTVTTTDDWASITTDATDGLSGLYDNKGVYFKFVAKDSTIGITTPTDDSDWIPLENYGTTFAALAAGEYDLYVYAKDNATNRSSAIKGNDTPIIVAADVATITIKKEVADDRGATDDIFLITLSESNAPLTMVALKKGDESSALKLGMDNVTSKTINISEVIPMDYDDTFVVTVINNQAESKAEVNGNIVTIHPGDDVTIVVKNTFAPTGFFKGKDFVKNLFQ